MTARGRRAVLSTVFALVASSSAAAGDIPLPAPAPPLVQLSQPPRLPDPQLLKNIGPGVGLRLDEEISAVVKVKTFRVNIHTPPWAISGRSMFDLPSDRVFEAGIRLEF